MPAREYHATKALGSTAIRIAADMSVRHARIATEKDATPAMRAGSLVHACTLEPGRIGTMFVVGKVQQCEGTTTKGAQCSRSSIAGAKHCRQHGGADEAEEWIASLGPDAEVVTSVELDNARAVSEGVRASVARSAFPRLLDGGDREVSYFARAVPIDEHPGYKMVAEGDAGIAVKARVDIEHGGLCLDLKGVGDSRHLSPRRWGWRVLDYGLHVQAALYVDIIEAVTGTLPQWGWLPHESSPPYGTRIFDVDDGDLDGARELIALSLDRWAAYFETGDEWAGWPTDRTTVMVPYRTATEEEGD